MIEAKEYFRNATKERRARNINNRKEATQTINPITGQLYLNFDYPKVGRLEDPIQAHLRAMEERNPSANEHRQVFLKTLIDRLSLIYRAFQYRNGEIGIFKKGGLERYYKESIYPNLYNLIKNESKIEKIIYALNEKKNYDKNYIIINKNK